MKNLQIVILASIFLALSFVGFSAYAEGGKVQNTREKTYERTYELGKLTKGTNNERQAKTKIGITIRKAK